MTTQDSPTPPLDDLLAHRVWVRQLARSLVRDAATADDVEQQVWLAALRAPPQRRESPRAWLGTVARNAARRLHRTTERWRRKETELAERYEPRSTKPDDIVERAETHRAVVDAVLALPGAQRRAVLLRYFEGLPVAAVARALDVPLETARSRLRLARGRLRTRLAPDVATARSMGLFALVAPPDGTTATTATAAATTTVTGVAMSTATKITAAAGLLLVLGLGNALVGAHDDVDRHEAALERLNARVEELQTAAEDAERENLRLRRAARTQEERYAQLAAELERATAQLAALPAREGGSESRAEPSPREGGERVRRVVEATATEGTGWERRVLAALAEEPDSERHAWAIAELVERLRGDPETAEWKWAERTLEGAARDGNIGPEEAARLERAYHGTARGSLAAPGLAAAAAVGWSDDERLEGFLAGIDRGDVHGRLLRILDHHPTEGFSRYVVRLVRDEHDPGVLRCAFDEDRAAAAAHSPETAREVVAAYAERLRDPRLDGRLRQKGYYAIGIAGMQAPIEAADALRELATGLPTDDEWRDRLTQAASLLQSGKARAKQVEKLLD